MRKLNTPMAIVVVALIGSLTFGAYLLYQSNRDQQLYERQYSIEKRAELRREQERELLAERRRQVYFFAEEASQWVVSKSYGGGRSVDYDVSDWEYNEYKDEYKIELTLNWSGKNFGGSYSANGLIRVSDEEATWEPQWHNSQLEEYLSLRNFMGVAIGSAIVIGALVDSQ